MFLLLQIDNIRNRSPTIGRTSDFSIIKIDNGHKESLHTKNYSQQNELFEKIIFSKGYLFEKISFTLLCCMFA